MTIHHLKIFITVYEEKNMTAAAEKMFLTQPTVSHTIKELEDKYDVVLFERLSRKLYPTASGEKMYQYATHITKLFGEMEDSLRVNSLSVKLSIGANYTAGGVLIHQCITEFKKMYPSAETMVTVNKSLSLQAMLRKNELDLAMMEELPATPDLVQDVFYDDRIVMLAHPQYYLFAKAKISVRDIANEPLLLREKGAGVRDLFETKLLQQGFAVKPYWESTSTTALINAAKNKIGIAVLPSQLVKECVDAGALRELPVEDLDLRRKLAIVYHKNKFMTEALRDFIRICHTL